MGTSGTSSIEWWTRLGVECLAAQGLDVCECFELFFEAGWLGFKLTDDGVQVEGQVARAVCKFGIVVFAGGLYAAEGQAKVLENTLGDFEAAHRFGAGPVEDAVEVAALSEFEQNFGNV